MTDLLVETGLRASAIFLLTLGAAALVGKGAAGFRYRILLAGVIASALLPFGLKFFPATLLRVPMLPASETVITSGSRSSLATIVPKSAAEIIASPSVPAPREPRPWLLIIFLAGAAWQAVRAITGYWCLRSIQRRSDPVILPARLAEKCADHAIRISDEITSPSVVGCLRPVILLPASASEWPEEKLAMVICHESAHLQRRDHWFHPLFVLVRMLYWWNPLAHATLKQLRRERENACDDQVIAEGFSAPEYADLLIETARSHARSPGKLILAMATPPVEGRVRRVLDPATGRRPPGRLTGLALLAILAGIWGAMCFVSIRFEAPSMPRFSLPGRPANSPPGKNKQIEVRVTLIEISEEVYRRHREIFDDAISHPDRASAERMLGQLSQKKGVNLLSAPAVTIRPGQEATVKIIREFRFPIEFAKTAQGLSPTVFETENLGMEIPLKAEISDGAIQIQGKLILRSLSGFTASERGVYTPAFQTSEAHFLRVLKDGEVCGMWVPGTHEISGQPDRLQRMMTLMSVKPKGQPTSTEGLYEAPEPTRLAMFLSTRLVGGAGNSSAIPDPAAWTLQWLADLAIAEFTIENASSQQAVDKLQDILVTAFPLKGRSLKLSAEFAGNETADIRLRDSNALAVLEEIKRTFSADYKIGAFSVEVFPLRPPPPPQPAPPPGDIPYASPVPGKPGFVTSPHAPGKGYVDLRGFPSGTEVKCPYTSKVFLVP